MASMQAVKLVEVTRNDEVEKDINNLVNKVTSDNDNNNVKTKDEKFKDEDKKNIGAFVNSKLTELLYDYFGLKFKAPIKFFNAVAIIGIHLYAAYGMFRYSYQAKLLTVFWGFLMGGAGGFGVTGGVHRLWCHRAYKAKTPLRIILMLCYSIAGQNTIYDWVRDHRVHHKYSETDADPHNSNRGFFFAHVGWLMLRKHPEVLKRGQQIDMSDIENDPVVQFHQKYFVLMKILCCFILPTLVPYYFWNESFFLSFSSQAIIRYILGLNFTWLVNSAAHMWGYRPYDKRINPVQSLSVSILAMGEGWHNYHHVFPWDYKAAELGDYAFNVTTFYIDLFAKIGWAYDLKQPSKDLVKRTIEKYGDGSHYVYGDLDNHHHHHKHMEEIPIPTNKEDIEYKR